MAESDREKHEKLDTQPATGLVNFADDGEDKKQVMGKGKLTWNRLSTGDPVTGSCWEMNADIVQRKGFGPVERLIPYL